MAEDFALRFKPVAAAGWTIAVVVVGSALVWGQNVLIPIAVAILLWQLINAVAKLFDRVTIGEWSPPRPIRVAAALALMIGALFVVALQVGENVVAVRAAAPVYQANLELLIGEAFTRFGDDKPPSVTSLLGRVDIGALITTLTTALGGLIGDAFLILIYVMFLFLEEKSFDHKIAAMFPDETKAKRVKNVLARIEERIEKYLWLKTVVSLLTAVICYLILILVGVDYAGFWATTIFLLNYIPTIGSLLAVVFPALLTIVQFGSFGPFFVVLISLGAAQMFVGNVVEPKLMGNSLNLSPMVLMLALSVWGAIWGVAGMFLCVPITVIAMITCSEFETTRPLAVALSEKGEVD